MLTDDAYGRGPIARRVTTLRGVVRRGNSGGPAVDSAGRVQTTVFAARLGSDSGYGVPAESVRRALAGATAARGLDRAVRQVSRSRIPSGCRNGATR